MKCVYLLESIEHPEEICVGLTDDLRARIRAHNSGQSKHTAKFMPWRSPPRHFRMKRRLLPFEQYLKTASGAKGGPMMLKTIVLSVGGIVFVTSLAAAAPPTHLFGKSVTVSWTENRVQRDIDKQQPHSITSTVQWTMYVSMAGRHFVRQQRSSSGGGGGSNTRDRAPGDGPAAGVQSGTINFNGTTMTQSAQYESGARQIVVSFDPSFGSCSARIIQGREGGRLQILRSQITGRRSKCSR